jgi:hypothetical protein
MLVDGVAVLVVALADKLKADTVVGVSRRSSDVARTANKR